MKQENLEGYCQLMLEIRHRASAVAALEYPSREVIPDFIRVELLVMQIRKILEIIALSSMVANEKDYLETYDKIEKHYHAKKILRFVKKLNPDFYPKPVSHTKTGDSTHHLEWKNEQDGSYLTIKEFEKLYDRCGALMHAHNPYSAPKDYAEYESSIRKWMTKIEGLLHAHVIKLVNDNNYYLIHMNSPDGKPHGFVLSPIPGDI